MSDLDKLREEYRNWWSATEGWTRPEGAQKADALIAALEAELEELAEELLGTRVTLDAAIGDSDYFRAGRDRAEALLVWAWRQQCVRNFPMALQSTYEQWRADLERYEPDDDG